MNGKPFFKPYFIGFAVGCILLVAHSFYRSYAAKEEVPNYGPLPHFELTDSTGAPFKSESMLGKVWLAAFFFTTCPDICPVITSQMTALQQKFPGPDINFVSITVDPATDTLPVLTDYKAKHGNDSRWFVLTGDREKIESVARDSFRLGIGDSPEVHSVSIALIDQAGNMRGYYRTSEKDALERLESNVRLLLSQPPQ